MATQVLIAHTGQRLEVDAAQFSLLDDLKTWVSRNTSIPSQHIVALTPQGRSVKFASLHAEKEIYVYDIRISAPASNKNPSTIVVDVPLPKPYSIPNAPNSISDVQAISSWQGLYKDRRAWAMRLMDDSTHMHEGIMTRYDEIDVIAKCLDAAVTNLELSIKQIEPKYNELKKWVAPALSEHDQLVKKWEHYLSLAADTPISASMVKFMTRGESTKSRPTLQDLIKLDTAKKAGRLAPNAHRRFSDKTNDLDKAAERMYQGLQNLIADFDKLMSRSALGRSGDSGQLLEDIEAVVTKMDTDYRAVLASGGSQRDLAQASKTASVHTEHMVPNLKKRVQEMNDLLHYVTEARNSIANESTRSMRAITEITSLHSSVKSQINVLNQSEEDMNTFDYLRLIHQLPYMYASFVVEAVRRREWVDKVKTDSSTLANEMALFQDEESKRRRKWQKMIGSTYGPEFDTKVVGLEVNLLGEDSPWPSITKDDLNEFVEFIQSQGVDQEILDDILKLVQELNNPTRQQSKRLKAFKNGSVHEAALGRSGLMIRGDDDLLRSLQDDKGKLENKLKTAESRVRRLEDLLHRQSQAARPNNLFQPQSPQPRERQNSVSSVRSSRFDDRRRSSGNGDHLLRRITQLENELRQEKQQSTRLQQEIATQSTQHEEMKGQIDEVNTTKRDLLGNMEALEREFVVERKAFEAEIKTLKARLEDTEDDLENFDESRQHEKATYVQRVEDLESELEQINKNRTDDTLKAQGQVEFLRKETRMQREQQEALERQIQEAEESSRAVAKKLQAAEEAAESQLEALRKLHLHFSPDQAVPGDLGDLADALLSQATGLVAKLLTTESDATLFKTDLEQANATIKDLRAEVDEMKTKFSEEEMSALRLREHLSEETAKVTALEGELAENREQLGELRSKLADGETGSEAMQQRLKDEEAKVVTLKEEVASRQSQVGSIEEELHLFREKVEVLQGKLTSQTHQYVSRDEKTKDLSQRLFSQNERLCRLLERVGFSIARQDGEMTITKIPRAERASQNPNDSSDPGSSIRRSVTLSRTLADSVDLEALYWLNNAADAQAEEEKYEAFMKTLGNFEVDLFCDTVYRRVKDVEHFARKWQREARSYREKYHTAQKDSHEKIAFKHFKEGDLALFLPTRNQQAGAWAAFNVGFPHYFLREQDAHRLRHREWLVARISRVEERVVDLSKSLQAGNEANFLADEENDNPFQLSDGLRWYLIDAHEDKPGAPSTPGMGKSTVAANTVEATANIHTHTAGKGKNRDSVASIEGINKTLSKSLESRRSSSGSKKATLPFQLGGGTVLKSSALASETNSLRAVPTDTPAGTSPTQALLVAANANLAPRSSPDGPEQKQMPTGSLAKSPPAEPSRATGATTTLDETQRKVQREDSAQSESKKSVVWDTLWTVDYHYESPSKR